MYLEYSNCCLLEVKQMCHFVPFTVYAGAYTPLFPFNLGLTSNLEIPLEDTGDVATVLNNGMASPTTHSPPPLPILKLMCDFFVYAKLGGGGNGGLHGYGY